MSIVIPFERSFTVDAMTPIPIIQEMARDRGWKYFRVSFDKQLENVIVTRISKLSHERDLCAIVEDVLIEEPEA